MLCVGNLDEVICMALNNSCVIIELFCRVLLMYSVVEYLKKKVNANVRQKIIIVGDGCIYMLRKEKTIDPSL